MKLIYLYLCTEMTFIKAKMAAVLKVKMQADAFMVCLAHALSTDREEVMGLLIGEVGQLFILKVAFSLIVLQNK